MKTIITLIFSSMFMMVLSPSRALADCYATDWVLKDGLDTKATCDFRYGVQRVEFKHALHHNAVHEERYRLICCTHPKFTNRNCEASTWMSKFDLQTSLSVDPKQYIRGIGFKHAMGENGTHQEWYRVLFCSTSWRSVNTYTTNWISKAPLIATGACPDYYYLGGLDFKHDFGQNLTYQESFRLECRR